MGYRHLPLCCQCGEVPSRIEEVGFTAEHELVVHWWCSNCRKVVYITKSLAECWRECPEPDLDAVAVASPRRQSDYEAEDARFLKSIGVRFLDN